MVGTGFIHVILLNICNLVGTLLPNLTWPPFAHPEREREHCLLQLDELDSNYDKNTQLYIIMYDKVNIKINIHIISH